MFLCSRGRHPFSYFESEAMTRVLTYSEPLPLGRGMAFDAKPRHARDDSGGTEEAGLAAARAKDPISAVTAFAFHYIPEDQQADFNRLVSELMKHIRKGQEEAAAEDSLPRDLRRRVMAGVAAVKSEAETSVATKFPALSRITRG